MESSKTQFVSRLVLITLFLLPLVYIGVIHAVTVHEVLGHGLAALCVGGEFSGFTVNWDGDGSAYAYPHPDAPDTHEIFILAAGTCVTMFSGILYLLLALSFRKRLFLRLFLLIFSFLSLLMGASYLFWNSYLPVPPGDIGRILALANISILRYLFMIFGGALILAVIFLLNAILFQGVEEWIGLGEPLTGLRKTVVLVIIIVLPGVVGWYVFDWNSAIPGIGLLPFVVGAVCHMVTAIILYRFSFKVDSRPHCLGEAVNPILLVWLLTGITLLSLWLWLDNGVYFNTEYDWESPKPVVQLEPPPVEKLRLLSPGFSPDGTVLACTLWGDSYAQPLLIDVPSFQSRSLVRLQGTVVGWYGFSWQPDGKKFVFTLIEAESEGNVLDFSIWLYDVQTNTARRLVCPSDEQLFQYPHFAPDGSSVLFRDAFSQDLYLCDVATDKVNRLTSFGNNFRQGYAWGVGDSVVTSTGFLGIGESGLWEVSTEDKLFRKISSMEDVCVIKPSPDRRILACWVGNSKDEEDTEYQLILFDTSDGSREDLIKTDNIEIA